MRADKYLVENGHFETRARAQEAIEAGLVTLDGVALRKASQKVPAGAKIEAQALHPYVSRAALKLVGGLDVFGVDPTGLICLDVGSSTGGFTEVLLERGAMKVYAVDVGREQLHARLRGDDRVVSMEATDARDLTAEDFDAPPSLIVCDASFISLLKVIPVPLSLAAERAVFVGLIKPQFEVGRDGIGRGGLVRSEDEALRAVDSVRTALDGMAGFRVDNVIPSPIAGGDGNQEYLVVARKG
ncbi:TlyA family RNA methyltransferase [Maricaulis sp.]|uniref:TlyA family RNA methyltransferase n=1 Tax=Maricaulis sp. TaxID=1486257 RepID=UPI001B2DB720|nr:TlyA family RNA methyltransferase [Maricaulis sp.]MBO6797211.1 TlyA family RNA methyltransferase [Maricaulis sp.]